MRHNNGVCLRISYFEAVNPSTSHALQSIFDGSGAVNNNIIGPVHLGRSLGQLNSRAMGQHGIDCGNMFMFGLLGAP
jgi:hypothetical protein